MIGYIKVYRKIREKWYWPTHERRPFTRFEAWLDICLNLALGKDNGHLKRGQFGASLSDLAKRWTWPRPKVRRFLAKLSKNEINLATPGSTQQATHLSTQVTVTNYNKLNPIAKPGSTPSEREGRGKKGEREIKNVGVGR